MEVKGFHIIADLSQCQEISTFDNEENLAALLLQCAADANATVLRVETHKFEPEGISGIVFLAESHLSVHIWPTEKYASLDCYTCGDTTDPEKAIETFIKKVKPLYKTVTEVLRGLNVPKHEGIYTHVSNTISKVIYVQ